MIPYYGFWHLEVVVLPRAILARGDQLERPLNKEGFMALRALREAYTYPIFLMGIDIKKRPLY